MALVIADGQPEEEVTLLRLNARLIRRIERLERRVQDLEDWLSEVGEDVAVVVSESDQREA